MHLMKIPNIYIFTKPTFRYCLQSIQTNPAIFNHEGPLASIDNILGQTRQLNDKNLSKKLGEVLKTLGLMIYVLHVSSKKELKQQRGRRCDQDDQSTETTRNSFFFYSPTINAYH